ncbi:four helix bundle protein [Thalassotalea aquiviva]|uniref:four helix bundle protein n=1 Tax=Thalassotalea aquiviva TaxID=3242415 RepID=UPI00352B4D9A
MNFEKLVVWQQAVDLSSSLYIYLKPLKDYGFKDQITRSGLSIPSNIAEGMARKSNKEKSHFINIALGSCAELRTQIYIGTKIHYIDDQTSEQWLKTTRYISAMLVGLRKKLTDSI